MKRIAVIILMAIVLPKTIFAQEYQYVPFPDSAAIWSEVYVPHGVVDIDDIRIFEWFAINGEDTVISNILYKKLYMYHDTVFNKNTATVVGGIREDEQKKVYYKGEPIHWLKPRLGITNDFGELLLYDFSLEVGDTAKIGNLSFFEDILIVTAIDTINVGGTYRKEFSFNFGVKWIEGIGHLSGLLYSSGATLTGDGNNRIICFMQNNQLIYGTDCILSGIEKKIYKNQSIKVYPNPANNEGVTFWLAGNIVSSLQIYDANGTSIGNYNVEGRNIFSLETEKYQSGMYFYRAYNKQGICTTGRFIIR